MRIPPPILFRVSWCLALLCLELPCPTPLAAETSTVSGTSAAANNGVPTSSLSPDVLAKFGDTQIKTDELRTFIGSLDPKQRESVLHDPDLFKKTVTSLIVQRLVLKEALTRKWDQRPGVAAEIKRARDNVITQNYLASMSQAPTDFPSPAELQHVYDANKGTLVVPRQLRMAQIYIACPQTADPATVSIATAKLDAVQKSLQKSTTDFAAVARMESDDKQSAAQAGEIGWVTESQIQPEIRSRLPALTPGAVSPPVRLKDGWHFLKVIDVREAYTPSLAQVRNQLIERLRSMKAEANAQAYVNKLLQQNPVSINPPAVATLLQKGQP